jgi:hypothetical protein
MSDTKQVVWMVGMDKFFLGVSHVLVCLGFYGLGIRGTQVKSSIQDIVYEVAPIKKAPLWS